MLVTRVYVCDKQTLPTWEYNDEYSEEKKDTKINHLIIINQLFLKYKKLTLQLQNLWRCINRYEITFRLKKIGKKILRIN